MKKILLSLGLIMMIALAFTATPVNAEEPCTHENLKFQYYLDGQTAPATCEESAIGKYVCEDCEASVYQKVTGEHSWEETVVDATCTDAQKVITKCTVCEEEKAVVTIGEALGHDWKETHVDATCTEAAGLTKACKRCDATEGYAPYPSDSDAYEAAKGHELGDPVVVAPTCKEKGYTVKSCKNCDYAEKSDEQEVVADAHDIELVSIIKEATCTTPGVGKYECKLCGAASYATIAAGCQFGDVVVSVAPTCAEAGKGTKTCKLCGKVEEVEVPLTGKHDYVETVIDATCNEPQKVGQICSVCDKEGDIIELGEPLGHNWKETHLDAACGRDAGVQRVCKVCKAEEFEAYEEGHELYEKGLEHAWDEGVVTVATCAAGGYTTYTCTECGETNVPEESKTGKNPENHAGEVVSVLKEATCTTQGVGKYACPNCDVAEWYAAIPAGCQFGEVVVVTAPTCAKEGKGTITCALCGKVEEVLLAATGEHTMETTVKDATCEDPQIVGEICSVCGLEGDTTTVGEALGHKYEEVHCEASCYNPAGTKKVCSVCKDETEVEPYTEEGLAKPQLVHVYEVVEEKAATCAAGSYTLEKCKLCGDEVETKGNELNPENHTPELLATLKEATCTVAGVGKYGCADCDTATWYTSIPAGCQFGEAVVTKEATCGAKGEKVATCKLCGKEQKSEIAATGKHDFEQSLKDATCTSNAKVGEVCKVCGATGATQDVADSALGHDYIYTHNDATCTTAAGVKITCSRCDYSQVDPYDEEDLKQDALGHDWENVETVAVTCSTDGYTTQKCSRCGKTQKVNVVKADGETHKPEVVATLKEATCTVAGVGKYACALCEEELGYKQIPAECKFGKTVVVTAATCAEDGKGLKTCEICGEEEEVVIPATGKHTFEESLTEATCTENAKVGEVCTVCGEVGEAEEVADSALGHDCVYTHVDATCGYNPETGADTGKPAGVLTTCTRCDFEEFNAYTEEDLAEEALVCDWELVDTVAVTCSTDGYKSYTCKVCGATKQEKTDAANGTSHVKELISTLKEATCTVAGVGKYACALCEAELGYATIDPAHAWGEEEVVKAATCGKDGKGKLTCTVCGETKDTVIKATGEHTMQETITDPTCTTPSYVGSVCTVCGKIGDVEEVADSVLGHDYIETHVDATCGWDDEKDIATGKAAGVVTTCSRCDFEEFNAYTEEGLAKDALECDWELVETVAVTCSTAGYTLEECKVCGSTKTTVTAEADKVSHVKELISTLKEATCTVAGVGKYACELCEAELGYASIPAGHAWGEEEVIEAATCGKDGKGKLTCTVCGETKDTVIEATGEHSFEENVKDATCTETAKVGEICTVCGATGEVEEVADSVLGHDYIETHVDATCGYDPKTGTDTGKPAGVITTCSRCDYEKFEAYTEEDLAEEALKCDWKLVKEVAVTCTTDGYKAYECKVCGATKKEVTTEADGVSHVDELVATLKEATCTTTGVGKYACALCEAELGYKQIEDGHAWGDEEVVEAATCAENGKGKLTCTVCGETKETVIEATGEHTMEETVVDATCTEAAVVGLVCTVCGEKGETTPVGEPLGHDYEEVIVEAGCEQAYGYIETCTVCGDKKPFVAFEGDLANPGWEHAYEVEEVVEPTCSAKGYTVYTCTKCGKSYNDNETEINEENHNPVLVSTLKEATCTVAGVGKYACADCEAELGYAQIAPTHTWGDEEVVEAATCGKDGKGKLTCTVCGETKDTVIEATGEHDYVETVTDATCTEAAQVAEVCTVCGDAKAGTPVGEPLGHDYEEVIVEAGCEQAYGYIETCTVCGDKKPFVAFEGDLANPGWEHAYEVEEVVEPTCSAKGYTVNTCTKCGKSYNDNETVENPNNHTPKLVSVVKEVTCTTDGVGKYECADCDADAWYGAVKASHAWGEVVVVTAPTCAEEGVGEHTCTVCGETEETVIEATGEHDYIETVIDATCTAPAKVGIACSVCGDEKSVVEVGDKLPHDFEEVIVEATCGQAAGIQPVCKVCGFEDEFVPFTGELEDAGTTHNYIATEVPGTCVEKGYTAEICEHCGEIKEGTKVEGAINPNNHDAELKEVIKPATCTVNGIGKLVCNDCGKGAGYVSIEAKHSWVEADNVSSTGSAVYNTCAVEGCEYVIVVAYLGENEIEVGDVFESIAALEAADGVELPEADEEEVAPEQPAADPETFKAVQITAFADVKKNIKITVTTEADLAGYDVVAKINDEVVEANENGEFVKEFPISQIADTFKCVLVATIAEEEVETEAYELTLEVAEDEEIEPVTVTETKYIENPTYGFVSRSLVVEDTTVLVFEFTAAEGTKLVVNYGEETVEIAYADFEVDENGVCKVEIEVSADLWATEYATTIADAEGNALSNTIYSSVVYAAYSLLENCDDADAQKYRTIILFA